MPKYNVAIIITGIVRDVEAATPEEAGEHVESVMNISTILDHCNPLEVEDAWES